MVPVLASINHVVVELGKTDIPTLSGPTKPAADIPCIAPLKTSIVLYGGEGVRNAYFECSDVTTLVCCVSKFFSHSAFPAAALLLHYATIRVSFCFCSLRSACAIRWRKTTQHKSALRTRTVTRSTKKAQARASRVIP